MAGNIAFHPAPGLGELMPGWFVVPQNPITDTGGVTYTPGIGDILPGCFAVPQNPIKDAVTGSVVPLATSPGAGGGMVNGQPVTPASLSGRGGCGCGGGCGGGCAGGMGDITSEWAILTGDLSAGNLMNVAQDTLFSVPVWAIAGVVALVVFAGGSESHYNRARRAARAY